MTIPADQDSIPAADIRPEQYVYYEGRWMPVANVTTTGGSTTVTLGPLTYSAEETVPVCNALLGAPRGR